MPRASEATPGEDNREREGRAIGSVEAERLTIKQTATGYWVVERGAVQLAGATTRRAAEAERDLVNRLHDRSVRRVSRRRVRTPRLAGSRSAGDRR